MPAYIPLRDLLEGKNGPQSNRTAIYLGGNILGKCQKCEKLFWPDNWKVEISTFEAIAKAMIPFTDLGEDIYLTLGSDFELEALNFSKLDPNPKRSSPSFIPKKAQKGFNKLVLPPSTAIAIEEMLVKMEYRELIYEEWGFKEVDVIGNGAILNFYGPPGTGKTRAAEALAYKLNSPYINIDLSELESRYMGETPKNIHKAFLAARRSDAILFFDEADTVLGKRITDVSQGIDNEINLTRSTMLRELELHDGVVIFATNFSKNFDPAFRRRITYHIRFDLPDLEGRRKLWNLHIVPKIPLRTNREELVTQLARESDLFSGGDILTAVRLALPAAIRENRENPLVALTHFQDAIERVYKAKQEVGKDFKEWGTNPRIDQIRDVYNVKTPNSMPFEEDRDGKNEEGENPVDSKLPNDENPKLSDT